MALAAQAKKRRVAAVPDVKPGQTMRGQKRQIAVALPPDLIDAVDARAHLEERSRAKMMEMLLRNALVAAAR